MATTNLQNGVTNAALQSTLSTYVAPDPTAVHQYFNDFDTYAAGDWTYTNVGAPTIALASGDGGLISFTNGAADDDHVYAQLVAPGFTFEAGKEVWFKARLKVSDATQSDVLVGLYLLDTSPIASAPADGVYFSKLDGSTTINAIAVKTGGSTSTLPVGTMANDTFVVLGFHFNGLDAIHVYLNEVRIGSLPITNMPTVPLSVSFVFQNGEAVSKVGTIDYLMAAKSRNAQSA